MTLPLLSLFLTACVMSALIGVLFALSRLFGKRFGAGCRRLVWTLVILRLCVPLSGIFLPKLVTFELSVPDAAMSEAAEPSEVSSPDADNQTAGNADKIPASAGSSSGSTDDPVSPASGTPTTATASSDPGTLVVDSSSSTPGIPAAAPASSGTEADPILSNPLTPAENPSAATPIEPISVSKLAPESSADPEPPKTPEPPATEIPTDETKNSPIHERVSSAPDLLMLILAVWIIGSLTFAVTLILESSRVSSRLFKSTSPAGKRTNEILASTAAKMGIKRVPKLLSSENATTPLLCRLTDPTILIPGGLPETDSLLGPILAHELTHYVSGDLFVKLTSAAARVIWWWNPLVHMAAKRLDDEIEFSCDEKVLKNSDDAARLVYSDAMLTVVKSRGLPRRTLGLTTQYSPSGRKLRDRIENILDSTKKHHGQLVIIITAISCVLAGCVVGCRTGAAMPSVDPADIPVSSGTYNGFTYNVYNNYIGLAAYSGRATVSLEIPSGIDGLPVAKIEDGFLPDGDYRFEKVVLPDSLVYIGDYSLVSKSGWLKNVKIPATVSYIGAGSLGGVDLGDDEFVIVGNGILMRYNGAGGNVTLPSGVNVIGSAFCENKNIVSLRVNRGCERIVPCAFAFSDISDVWLPDSVKSIGSDCFRGGNLTGIRLPSGECDIGKNAFETDSTAKNLTLTVSDASDAFLYAVENDLPFMFENGDGMLHSAEYLKSVGTGIHDFTLGNKTLSLEIKPECVMSDKSTAIVPLDGNSDGMTDLIYYVSLRTKRVTDEVRLGRDELMAAIDKSSEPRDYSDCEISGKLDFLRRDMDNFVFCGELSVKHDSDEWRISVKFVYTPGSGYVFAKEITTNVLTPDYLEGFSELAATDDKSAKLYGKPADDGFDGSLMIRWTFGAITLDTEKFTKDSSPRLKLSDMNGDGVKDLVLLWFPDGKNAESTRECAEVFYGPTGAKKSLIDPLSDFESEVTVTIESGPWAALDSRFGKLRLEFLDRGSMRNLTFGNFTFCEIYGDYLIASVSVDYEYSFLPWYIRLVYRFENGKMTLKNILNPIRDSADDTSRVLQIAEKRYLLAAPEGLYEFTADSVSGFTFLRANLDGDLTDDLIVVCSTDSDPAYDAETQTFLADRQISKNDSDAFVVTSSDKKLRKIDTAADISEIFSVRTTGNGWLIDSRFGTFALTPPESNESFTAAKLPDLTKKRFWSVENGNLFCDLQIKVGSDRYGDVFSDMILRMNYRLDSIFRVKSVEAVSEGEVTKALDYDSFYEYLKNTEAEGVKTGEESFILTDRGDAVVDVIYENGSPKLSSVTAKNQTLTFETPLTTVGNMRFRIYEAGGYLIIESLYHDFGDTYIITDDSILRNHTWQKQKTEDYLSFHEKDGKLAYTRRSVKYNSIDVGQYGFYLILDNILSRDEFLSEEGIAEIIDGNLVLTPEKTTTLSEEFDLEAGFNEFHDYVASFRTLDDVIARNLRMTSNSVKVAIVAMTLDDFRNEILRMMALPTGKELSATITDADNAVLIVSKGKYATVLSSVEARGYLFAPKNPIVFDNLAEFTLFATGNVTILQTVNADGACDRYIFYPDGVYEEHDSAEDAKYVTNRFSEMANGGLHYEKKIADDAPVVEILRRLESRDDAHYETGDLQIYKGVRRIPRNSKKLSELYDLDAEFEKYKSELGYERLDEMIADHFAKRNGFEETIEAGSDELEKLSLSGAKYVVRLKTASGTAVALIDATGDQKKVIGFSANGRNLILDDPFEWGEESRFEVFAAGGSFIFQLTVGEIGYSDGITKRDAYIFTSESIITDRFDASADGAPENVLIFYSDPKRADTFRCRLTAIKFTGDDISRLKSLTAFEELYYYDGEAVIDGGEIRFLAEWETTMRDAFDLRTMFDECHAYFPGHETLDDLIAANAAKAGR